MSPMTERSRTTLSPAGRARRDAMLDELVGYMRRTHRLKMIRRRLVDAVAVVGLGMLLGIAAWVFGSHGPSDDPPGGGLVESSRPADRVLVRQIDDSELLRMLAEIGRPAGLVRSESRVWLTNAVTDAELGLREPPKQKPPA